MIVLIAFLGAGYLGSLFQLADCLEGVGHKMHGGMRIVLSRSER